MHVCRRSVELCLFIADIAFMAALAAVAAVKTLAVEMTHG
jgi:hypothetical protein